MDSSLRTAAQQALEAMLNFPDDISDEMFESITALKAALAEPVQEPEPGEYHGWVLREVLFDNGEPVGHREPVQEPVAWRYSVQPQVFGASYWAFSETKDVPDAQPLYTAPPQRKPLTEEEIDSIWDSEKAFADIYAIARAIERAHGIGGQP